MSILHEVLGNRVMGIFALMDITEDEIKHAQRKHKAHHAELFDAFMTCVPTNGMSNKHHALYRSHCKELLTRIVNGHDVTLATKAEVMIALMDAAAAVPLHPTPSALANKLFAEMLPDEYRRLNLHAAEVSEPYKGATDQLLAEMQTRFKHPDRHVPDAKRWHRLQAEQAGIDTEPTPAPKPADEYDAMQPRLL